MAADAREGSNYPGTKKKRMFAEVKLRRVLTRMSVSWENFLAEYDADKRRHREARRELSEEEKAAVRDFFKHRSPVILADRLGLSRRAASTLVARYIETEGI